MSKTIIKVRKGVNGFKYAACDAQGNFLRNFSKLGDVRKYWKKEIQWGKVELVRELDKDPDFSTINSIIEHIEKILTRHKKSTP